MTGKQAKNLVAALRRFQQADQRAAELAPEHLTDDEAVAVAEDYLGAREAFRAEIESIEGSS